MRRDFVGCEDDPTKFEFTYLIVQVHWPATGVPGPVLTPSYEATWGAMEALVGAGLVRSIGVSNLSAKKLRALLDTCVIRPAVNQVAR